mgnify:FL=1
MYAHTLAVAYVYQSDWDIEMASFAWKTNSMAQIEAYVEVWAKHLEDLAGDVFSAYNYTSDVVEVPDDPNHVDKPIKFTLGGAEEYEHIIHPDGKVEVVELVD